MDKHKKNMLVSFRRVPYLTCSFNMIIKSCIILKFTKRYLVSKVTLKMWFTVKSVMKQKMCNFALRVSNISPSWYVLHYKIVFCRYLVPHFLFQSTQLSSELKQQKPFLIQFSRGQKASSLFLNFFLLNAFDIMSSWLTVQLRSMNRAINLTYFGIVFRSVKGLKFSCTYYS